MFERGLLRLRQHRAGKAAPRGFHQAGARRSALAALLLAALALLPGAAISATFHGGGVWANRPREASYTPRAHEAFNTARGPVQIRRTSTGSYGIFFGGLARANAMVQVTAAGPHGDRCQVVLRRVVRGGLDVTVACRNAAGRAVDSAFSLLALAQQGTDVPLGYVLADQRSTASYSATTAKSFSAGGAVPKVRRTAVGRYDVTFPRLTIAGGNVQVAADGLIPAHCKVTGWGPGSSKVVCFNDSGGAIDAAYSLLMLDARSLGGAASFAWANQATAASYQASGSYTHNAAGGGIPIERRGVGTYSVRFEGQGAPGGVALVTAYGNDALECNLGGLGAEGRAQRVDVHCFGPDGAPRDSRFSLLYVRDLSGGSAHSPIITSGPTTYSPKPKKPDGGPIHKLPTPAPSPSPSGPGDVVVQVPAYSVLYDKVLTRDLALSLVVSELTAELVTETRKAGQVEADAIRWSCAGRRCTARSHLAPTVDLCKSLALQVGRIAAFSSSSRRLDSAQVESCNRSLFLVQLQPNVALYRPVLTVAPGASDESIQGEPGPLPVALPLYEAQLDRIPQILDDFAAAGGWDYFVYPDGRNETKYYYVPREYRIALAEGTEGVLAVSFNYLSATEDGQDVVMTAKLRPPSVVGDFSLLQRLTAETVGLDRDRLELLPFPIESAELDIAQALADFGVEADRVRVRAPSNVLEPIDLSIALDEIALQNLISQLRTECGLGGIMKLRSGDVIATVPVTLSFARFSGGSVTEWTKARESRSIANRSPFPVSVRGMVAYVDSRAGIRRETWSFDRPIDVAPVETFEMPGLELAFRGEPVVHAWMDYGIDIECSDCLDTIEDRATTQTGLLRRDELTVEALGSVFSSLGVVKLVVELEGASFSPDGGVTSKTLALYEESPRVMVPVWLDRSGGVDAETARYRAEPITAERPWGFTAWQPLTGLDITLTPYALREVIRPGGEDATEP